MNGQIGDDRLARYVNGETPEQISAADGTSRATVLRSIVSAIYRRSELAIPGSSLPTGCQWIERMDGSWYVSGLHTTGRGLPTNARWAMSLDEAAPTDGTRLAHIESLLERLVREVESFHRTVAERDQ